ncbi:MULTISPECIES: TonB-dependent hemoglobin/transferrin/lactoferrin family receptor [Haemophilus]|jgi:tonB-dependent hemoglobin/transferrin/lactoferrin receptor family protein|uniref:TonB-dependent hemoglobin/transferrin/lactoferrin family receptor n=1 Tax=Haemophilus TaxID=724 RepID=UPI000664E0F1|nr:MULTISPECIES: TonB-dependent hemoglobin/transferrin/lactoferrin family receptor [Haemophilus]MBS6000603.1 TonB-dependent hemoglobin/transferrin/lactoferrin family receptor [Haemophilus haemolyticus]MDK7281545.1 TonB-dependent hemoglobin/transferrin/lactoferrin family receptor [Haemophilus seminalis]TPH02244.1 TonB-dependent hemoglobin/transferrin/lactoferrin family receptor [Haemophilus haemolyticus]
MKQHKLTPYALLLITAGMSVTSYALAEEQLSEIKVTDEISSPRKTQSAVIHKNEKTIQKEMIRDTRDLVRYTTDVGISDNGRFLKGFSIRGVENNRVGISIDGVNLPDSEENSLYARYGNFNSSRLSIDSELVREIDIVRGSDSFNQGSGYLGGGVNYRTLEAGDFLLPNKNYGVLLRNGYASKNREWFHTMGLGYIGEKVDLTLLYSYRNGHEMKSAGSGELVRGQNRQTPDPSKHWNNSYLAKIGYQLNDENRINFSISGQKSSRYTDEYSYNLLNSYRESDDSQKIYTINTNYQYLPKSGLFTLIRADFDYQQTNLGSVNHKGDYVYSSWRNEKDLSKNPATEVDDRQTKTKYKRVSLRLDTKSFDLFGDHRFSFQSFVSEKNFQNVNYDTDIDLTRNTRKTNIYTIQNPVKTTQYGVSLLDNVTFNDIFSANVGIRYDHTKMEPLDYNVPYRNPQFQPKKPEKAKFNDWTGLIGLNGQINEAWKLSYLLSTGYRLPSASEMFFTYENIYGNWAANPDLKTERSLSQSLTLQGRGEKGDLDVTIYHTRYRNFLYEQETEKEVPNKYYDEYSCYNDPKFCNPTIPELYQQMVNLDRAKISGIEFKGSLNLHSLYQKIPDGFKLFGALGYSKGSLSNGESLQSIQPIKTIFGLDYESPNKVWGIFSRFTYLGAKKDKDAKIQEVKHECLRPTRDWYGDLDGGCEQGADISYNLIKPYRWLNGSAFVVDLFGYYKPVENVTLRAGVYNLLDRKYHTWDSLRGINRRSTTNGLNWDTGYGLERFYQPGRNFSASVEIRF